MIFAILLLVFTIPISSQNKEEEKEEKPMEMAVRFTSDHNFRGYSYSSLASQRNNTSYSAVNFVPSVQPQFVYSTPLKGLKTLFWGNFFLNNMTDRDSDMYLLQDAPGEKEKFNSIAGDPSGYYPSKTKRYKERNGMSRYDGIFFGIYYEWTTITGTWTFGTWIWNNMNRYGKYTWQEYFLWYAPPFWKWANPKLSFFLNTSFDNGGSNNLALGYTNGQNYISIEVGHTFLEGSPVTITPKLQAGYVVNNDNVNRRSGVLNILQSLKFGFDKIDLTLSALYRPDADLYDTSDPNKLDGRLPDPSKQYGPYQMMYDELKKRYPEDLANRIGYEQTSEKFIKMLYIISMGYSWEF